MFYRYKNSDSGGLQYLFLSLFSFMKQLQQDLDQHSSCKMVNHLGSPYRLSVLSKVVEH